MLEETITAILKALNRHKVPYVFFGMEALNWHLGKEGRETFATKDSDFHFDPAIANPQNVLKILTATPFPEPIFVLWKEPGKTITLFDGWKWKTRRISGGGTFSIGTPEGYYSIDLAFGDSGIPFKEVWRKSSGARYFGVPVRVAHKDHLLEMKRRAGRDKDLQLLMRLSLNERSVRPALKKEKNRPKKKGEW